MTLPPKRRKPAIKAVCNRFIRELQSIGCLDHPELLTILNDRLMVRGYRIHVSAWKSIRVVEILRGDVHEV